MASTCKALPDVGCAGEVRGKVPELIQALQSLVVIVFAPLYAGAIARAEAIVGSKRGPSVLQPYRDLGKLLRKGSAVSDQASWVFRGAPFVAFACFRYEQLGEIDRRLKRLDARYRAMSTPGTAGGGKGREAVSALAGYRAALDEYASSVYATDSAS
jgi:hypothetical protein